MLTWPLWCLVAVPLGSGLALLCAGRRADGVAAPVGLAGAVLTLVLAVFAAARGPALSVPYLEGIPFGLRVDGLSGVLVVTLGAVLLAVLGFASGQFRAAAPESGEFGPAEARGRFFGLMLLFAGAMLVTVTATTLVALLMAWEVMGATSYALIGFWWRDPRRVESGLVAFLATRAGDLGLYFAAGAALAGGAGGLGLAELPGLPDGWRDAVAAGVVLAALGKSAQLPFSFWLSRAMDGPSPVSALLHSAAMVAAGAYLLVRLEPLLAATPWAAGLVAWAGVLTAVVLGAVAVAQADLKQLLAASTCAQVGFMLLAAGTGGAAAGSAQLVAHAFTKSLLFLAAGAWLAALGTGKLAGLRGAARRFPAAGLPFTVGALTLAGLPPLSLWAAKDAVLAAAREQAAPLYLAGLAAAALSAGYAARALVLVWTGVPGPATEAGARPRGTGVVTRAQWAALPPVAAVAALLGVLALHGVWSAYADAVDGGGEPSPTGGELLLSAAVALTAAGTAAVVIRHRGELPALPRRRGWLGLEKRVDRFVVRPVLAVAGLLARFEGRVFDQVAEVAATGGRGFARGSARSGLLTRFDDRAVDRTAEAATTGGGRFARGPVLLAERMVEAAVGAVTGGARFLGRLARRPQTGQLHQYYAQVLVTVAVLVVLLVALGCAPDRR